MTIIYYLSYFYYVMKSFMILLSTIYGAFYTEVNKKYTFSKKITVRTNYEKVSVIVLFIISLFLPDGNG